jgi:antitoxin component YwqK of YwqJK toxin-antitoxin module
MKKIYAITMFALLSTNLAAQKVIREYYGYNKVHIKYEYQVDRDERKNGYWKHYCEEGGLFETGYYLKNMRSGIWKYYNCGNGKMERLETWKNDMLNGEQKLWYVILGTNDWPRKYYLRYVTMYKNNDKVNDKEYDMNGKIISETNY